MKTKKQVLKQLRKDFRESVFARDGKCMTCGRNDARHDYRSVYNDISAWYPKVKKGGIIAGHDYFYRNSRRNLVEVSRAVKDFFYNKHNIYSTTDNLPSWYVWK